MKSTRMPAALSSLACDVDTCDINGSSQLETPPSEQAGEPTDLYDQPVNSFVHGFLGPTTEFGGVAVRPHDLELFGPGPGGETGVVTGITALGFEVQVTVGFADAQSTWVQMSRNEFNSLGIAIGSEISVRPRV